MITQAYGVATEARKVARPPRHGDSRASSSGVLGGGGGSTPMAASQQIEQWVVSSMAKSCGPSPHISEPEILRPLAPAWRQGGLGLRREFELPFLATIFTRKESNGDLVIAGQLFGSW